MKSSIFLLLFILFACNDSSSIITEKGDFFSVPIADTSSVKPIQDAILSIERIDSLYALNDLIDVQSINSGIIIDVKYASTDNFMGHQLYDTIQKIYLNKDIAERLSKSQNYLDSILPGYSLLVYDGVRPLSVQRKMWEALDSIPVYRRGKFVSNPRYGSVHNYGAAVDLTIVDSNGNILDMGAGYDDFRAIAFPSREKEFLASGDLTMVQFENRKLLRKVMRFQHFYNIPSEWWHFNAFSRGKASNKLKCLMNESGDFDWFIISPPKKDSMSLDIRDSL